MNSTIPDQSTILCNPNNLQIKTCNLGLQDYQSTWQSMVHFTQQRTVDTQDQLWLVQHPAVYTMGLAAKKEHILHSRNIPIINTDRGGQVTYHGPGQIIIYLLLDIKRRNIGIKSLVQSIEQALIQLLKGYAIEAHTIDGAPGVYVSNSKIAALGLRVRRNGCYHGLSLNIDMDLSPFLGINPCGYAGLKVIQLKDLNPDFTISNMNIVQQDLLQHLLAELEKKTQGRNNHE